MIPSSGQRTMIEIRYGERVAGVREQAGQEEVLRLAGLGHDVGRQREAAQPGERELHRLAADDPRDGEDHAERDCGDQGGPRVLPGDRVRDHERRRRQRGLGHAERPSDRVGERRRPLGGQVGGGVVAGVGHGGAQRRRSGGGAAAPGERARTPPARRHAATCQRPAPTRRPPRRRAARPGASPTARRRPAPTRGAAPPRPRRARATRSRPRAARRRSRSSALGPRRDAASRRRTSTNVATHARRASAAPPPSRSGAPSSVAPSPRAGAEQLVRAPGRRPRTRAAPWRRRARPRSTTPAAPLA